MSARGAASVSVRGGVRVPAAHRGPRAPGDAHDDERDPRNARAAGPACSMGQALSFGFTLGVPFGTPWVAPSESGQRRAAGVALRARRNPCSRAADHGCAARSRACPPDLARLRVAPGCSLPCAPPWTLALPPPVHPGQRPSPDIGCASPERRSGWRGSRRPSARAGSRSPAARSASSRTGRSTDDSGIGGRRPIRRVCASAMPPGCDGDKGRTRWPSGIRLRWSAGADLLLRCARCWGSGAASALSGRPNGRTAAATARHRSARAHPLACAAVHEGQDEAL